MSAQKKKIDCASRPPRCGTRIGSQLRSGWGVILPSGKRRIAMTSGLEGDRLSWGDALFLYLERAGMPLNIACVSIFDGEISLEGCIGAIEAKLPLFPRYY